MPWTHRDVGNCGAFSCSSSRGWRRAREGSLREALTSLRSLFDQARQDIAAAPLDNFDLAEAGDPPAIVILAILNVDLRPFLARWHPRLTAWEKTGQPETSWPLAAACRADFETTRLRVVAAAWELGRALRLSHLDRLLPPAPSVIPDLLGSAEVAALEDGVRVVTVPNV